MSTKQRHRIGLDDIGTEFTIKGQGRYRLITIRPNGELNAWGPINTLGNTPHGMMRSFRPEWVDTIHRKKRGRK